VDITLNQGYPDRVGRRYIFCGSSVGPTSYTTGGESLNLGQFNNYIDVVIPALSVSGTYILYGIPTGLDRVQLGRDYIVTASTGAQVSALDESVGGEVRYQRVCWSLLNGCSNTAVVASLGATERAFVSGSRVPFSTGDE
jgi:hypothetical protein